MFTACGRDDAIGGASGLDNIKSNTSIELFITSEFDTSEQLSVATISWEDGLHISWDRLDLYATYKPMNFLSFVLNGDPVENLQN